MCTSPGDKLQTDAIQYVYSTDGGNSFIYTPPVHTFVTASTSYPAGSVFDQPQLSGDTFRTLDVPTITVDAKSRVWIAYSQRVMGPTPGTYGSRIMLTTLPSGFKARTAPYMVDRSSPLANYGHQFMPTLSFAFGKIMVAWLDSRNDNKESILACATGNCTDLSQLTSQLIPIPGSTVATPSSVFTANMSDPNSGIRHTLDVFGALIDPTDGPATAPSLQISQYPFWVSPNKSNRAGLFQSSESAHVRSGHSSFCWGSH